ncbi:unnamed protein product [Heligmosomoides polygyrus]|uniref:Uncharacterized protein n=1 Tax=Heligmosomoides polygyrus TaxID=6339 RepID=A0A3P8CA34_HELPZ|nr:unnamed protein product [Heligmosomoides polygyrus]
MRNLHGDKEKYSMYNQTFHSYLREGIIQEAKDNSNRVAIFYLPHRHVWTPPKSTLLVFDASSHAKDELSHNDVIYEGCSLMPLIHDVLLQFRTHVYTMVADTQKAFLQIRLPDSHRDAKVSMEISNSLYVDNVFLKGKSPGDVLHKYTESKRLFSSIGMNLRDYLSNSTLVNIEIPKPDRASSTEIKVIGILWNSMKGTISLKCGEKPANKISKRTILSQISGCCLDPLGLLTPLMTPAKILVHVALPSNVVENNSSRSHTLPLFVDSSKQAYACSIYVTTTSCHGIAPINKEQTILRLELLSLFIGSCLDESTVQKINVKFEEISIFSDSTIAVLDIRKQVSTTHCFYACT